MRSLCTRCTLFGPQAADGLFEAPGGEIGPTAQKFPRALPGGVFISFRDMEAAANLLTTDALDPSGKIPEFFEVCAVRVEKAY